MNDDYMPPRDFTEYELKLEQAMLGCGRISDTELAYLRARLLFWVAQLEAVQAKRDDDRRRKAQDDRGRDPYYPDYAPLESEDEISV